VKGRYLIINIFKIFASMVFPFDYIKQFYYINTYKSIIVRSSATEFLPPK